MSRIEAMRAGGVYICPEWCTQDDDEEEVEGHLTAWRPFQAKEGHNIMVRARLPWFDDLPAEIIINVDLDGEEDLPLSLPDARTLSAILDELTSLCEGFNTVWAWEGAGDDEAEDLAAAEDDEDDWDDEDEE